MHNRLYLLSPFWMSFDNKNGFQILKKIGQRKTAAGIWNFVKRLRVLQLSIHFMSETSKCIQALHQIPMVVNN